MKRRDFIKTTAVAAGGLLAHRLTAETTTPTEPAATVWIVHGKDPAAMLKKGMELAGGWNSFVKKDARVTLKVNAAWAVKPEDAGNTHPDLVKAFCLAAFEAGAKSVTLPEITCSPAAQAFAMSGIEGALKGTKARLFKPEKESDFRKVAIPKGVDIKEAVIPVDVLDCDFLVNMPVAKSHGASKLTLSMKNWMGSDQNRGIWHQKNLHQCIVDFSTVVKPHLIIIDATRIMATKGPRGPGRVDTPNKLILGRDPVACDAVAAGLFDMNPLDIPFIRMAQETGLGCGDPARINKVEVEA